MTASLTPSPVMAFFDANGNPLVGGKIYTYAAGTTTPLATYTDYGAGTPNANPVILNSRGEAAVWCGSALYYIELKDSLGNLIWTADNVGGVLTQASFVTYQATLLGATGSSLVGFIQSGTGAIATTMQTKARQVFSVFDFMSAAQIADTIARTASLDVTSAVAAAITAAAAVGGGEVYFPAGTYGFPSPVTVTSKSNVTLRGAGRDSTILLSTIAAGLIGAGSATVLFFNGCTNVSVQDITLSGNGTLTTNINTSLLAFTSCNYAEFVNSAIINTYRIGMWIVGTNDFRVAGNLFLKAGSAEGTYQNEAIASSGTINRGWIQDNYLRGWGTLLDGNDLVITGNIITGWTYGAGISLNAANTLRPIVIGNNCSNSSGIDVNSTYPSGIECWAPYAVIQGNVCYFNGSAGISFQGEWTICTGNICINNGTSAPTGAGISNAYYAGSLASYSIVANNMLGDTGPGYQKYGYIQSDTAGAVFSEMIVANNSVFGNTTAHYHFGAYSVQNKFTGYAYEASSTYTIPTLTTGLSDISSSAITVAGAVIGDYVTVSSDAGSRLAISGYVTSANTVQVLITNTSTSTYTTTGAASNFHARVVQRRP